MNRRGRMSACTALRGPELENARAALRQVLAGREPYPAAAVDRCWEMEDAKSGVALLAEGCSRTC
jgi:hypothetical protein